MFIIKDAATSNLARHFPVEQDVVTTLIFSATSNAIKLSASDGLL